MADQDMAPPLSLRDRIRQLEQAAHSPLTFPSPTSTAAGGPTSTSTSIRNALTVEQVSQADDPLQSAAATKPYAATSKGTGAESRKSLSPPPKPPRPVWVSRAKENTEEATGGTARPVFASGRRTDPDREASPGTGSAALLEATSTNLPLSTEPPAAPSTLTAEATKRRSAHGSDAPSLPTNKPSLPARLAETSSSSSSSSSRPATTSEPLRSSSVSSTDSTATATAPAPALPPRPAWARKPSPSPSPSTSPTSPSTAGSVALSPISGPAANRPTPTAATVREMPERTAVAGSSAAPSAISSASPALPPRPRWTPSPTPPASRPSAAEPSAPTVRAPSTSSAAGTLESANARRRYNRLFSQCVEATASSSAAVNGNRTGRAGQERLDAALVGELWRRSKLEDAVLRKIWNEVASSPSSLPPSTSTATRPDSLDRDGFARGMELIDAELRRRQTVR
ncbi:hypothetical protein JCM10908_004202 [Rhodotorula pacifica]|uniref:uncharacterized protein n=1 Tax=Rhodotorula pacifica TaxID=1495444 RepID=UPI00316D60DA